MQENLLTTTHQVTNQVPLLSNYNAFETDIALSTALQRYHASWHQKELMRYGGLLTTPEILELAPLANHHTPELITHNTCGERIDTLTFHPSWHQLLGLLRKEGLHALPFSNPQRGAMAARCAGYFLHAQLESGSLCPLTMTFASIPVLQKAAPFFSTLAEKLYTREHDSRDLPLAKKHSMMVGMGMTEKQGGSDVRTNQTCAYPIENSGLEKAYRLIGHKWFFSAPQCDAHLVLARTSSHSDISCFYVPRFMPDGKKNAIHIQRLKNKLGNRSNASSEVEFLNAYGLMIGDEGRGVPTIIEMANYTRLDCVIGSAALMRAALIQTIHHTHHRTAFGRRLADQPLMRNVLADMALESEAATTLFMALAHAFEQDERNEKPLVSRGLRRIITPAAKFWICKRTLEFTGEAMEVWGGNGYIDTECMARFYREAPVNSIWEGSGNIMCLDVLRAIEREPDAFAALLEQWHDDAKQQPQLAKILAELTHNLALEHEQREMQARRIAQQLVLITQASLLLQHAPAIIADAFIDTRLSIHSHDCGRIYGTLPSTINHAMIINRAFPY